MIRYATEKGVALLSEHDPHISKEELENIVRLRRVLAQFHDGKFVGWLRYNLFVIKRRL